jgi:peptidoglycan biosynthesis protein MviN/MurJ (putative lipid II flippase)
MVTVVLDLLLIPRFGAVGAAAASSAAYMTTTGVLLVMFWLMAGPSERVVAPEPTLREAR